MELPKKITDAFADRNVYESLGWTIKAIVGRLDSVASSARYLNSYRESGWSFEFERSSGELTDADRIVLETEGNQDDGYLDERYMIRQEAEALSDDLMSIQQLRRDLIEMLRSLPECVSKTLNCLPNRGEDWALYLMRQFLVPVFRWPSSHVREESAVIEHGRTAFPSRVDLLLALFANADPTETWKNYAADAHAFSDDLAAAAMRDSIAINEESPEDAEQSIEGITLSLDARAIGCLTEHPDWSNTKVAKALGCHRTSLYRCEKYMAARELLEGSGKAEMNRGSKYDGAVESW